ncbi:MAG: FAD-dependent oxidoreductase [bacterium]|nr:FAD-dependent oxidoreductase [bacterium]
MITLIINDKQIEVEEGTKILEAAQRSGIKIPTLCSHKALSPYGACRLCLVEITKGNQTWTASSCTYPAEEGLVIKTHSQRVIKARRILLELLLTRYPDSIEIQKLAKEMGITKLRLKPKDMSCILCGLCVRMCNERMGISAMGFINRGANRMVSPPFGKQSDICHLCGACVSICPTKRITIEDVSGAKRKPIPIPSKFDEELGSRSPIHIFYPQGVPSWPVIDHNSCVHLLKGKCGICEVVCQAKAIDYEQEEKKMDIDVGAVILAPGYDKFEPKIMGEYGYSQYQNVITSLQFERILSASGPYGGHLHRLSDDHEPKKIAWIQCVGSRDMNKGNSYCSSVCCTYAVKEAIIAKEHSAGGLDATIFFMDMRTFGKGFEEYYNRAKDEYGVRFVRSRVAQIKEVEETKNLILRYEDDKENKIKEEEFDMVVLSVGMIPKKGTKELAGRLGIELNEYGFCQTDEFAPVAARKEGIYVAGVFESPKDIPETVMQASGAAARVGGLLASARGTLITKKEYPPEIDVVGQEPRIGVFICHCGINIAGVVDVPSVVEYVKTLPDVIHAENKLYTCSSDTQQTIMERIKEHKLNRVVVAACTPRTHEPLFRNTIRQAGLNPYLFEMANIRDQCSWVHINEPEKATKKAKDLVRMAIAKARLLEPLYPNTIKVNQSALVIGGGLAGMQSALDLSAQGFQVHLVEKETELGGNLRKIQYLLGGGYPKQLLEGLIENVAQSKKINLYLNTFVSKVDGSLGNFTSTLNSGIEIEHGIIIVATGADEYTPTEYLYGRNERVVTQLELEEQLVNPKSKIENRKSVVMIQCIGSREPDRPYCSRICCSEAIKNALKLKEINPKHEVYVLYRDVRTYGFKEEYYRQAREAGVIFIRYKEDEKPEVCTQENGLIVKVKDLLLGQELLIDADLVVLSAGMVANPGNKDLAQLLKVPVNQNGFFLEAHIKLKPIDFATDGIYMAGLAHCPKDVSESISQASGAAGRAATVLSKDELEIEAALSFVVDANCDGCAYCVDPCPYQAITLVEYEKDGVIKKTVKVDEAKCKGCGVCMATCPKKGIYVRHFKPEMLSAMVEAALQPVV